MWTRDAALENTIEAERGHKFDEKSYDYPVRLVCKADTVDEDLGYDQDEGDEQLLEVEKHKLWAEEGRLEVFFASDLVSSDCEECCCTEEQERQYKYDP